MTRIEVPLDVPADVVSQLEWIAAALERQSKAAGFPADLEYMRQCGEWTRNYPPCWHPGRPKPRDWHMEVAGHPVYSVDVSFAASDRESITVYHWKGDIGKFELSSHPEGNLDFDGVRRDFTGEIALRGF